MSLSLLLHSASLPHSSSSSYPSSATLLSKSSFSLPPPSLPIPRHHHHRNYHNNNNNGSGNGVNSSGNNGTLSFFCLSSRKKGKSCCSISDNGSTNSSLLLGHRWFPHGINNNAGGERDKARGQRVVVCSASASASLSTHTLQWISAISSLVLMLAKGTAIQKSFLVPLFALQAPISVISWIKGEYGTWTAFLALLVRLFYFIPGELDLPFLAILLVIVAPYQTMDLRGTQAGAIISLVIAGYLAFQHFSRAGSLQKAFDQGSIVATLAVICIITVPCLLLF